MRDRSLHLSGPTRVAVYKFMGHRIVFLSDVHQSDEGYCTTRQMDVTDVTNLVLGFGISAQEIGIGFHVFIEGGGMDTDESLVCETPAFERRYPGPLPDTYCTLTALDCIVSADKIKRAIDPDAFVRARRRPVHIELVEPDASVSVRATPDGNTVFHQLDVRWQCGMQKNTKELYVLTRLFRDLVMSEMEMRPGTRESEEIRRSLGFIGEKMRTHASLRDVLKSAAVEKLGVSIQDAAECAMGPAGRKRTLRDLRAEIATLADLRSLEGEYDGVAHDTLYDGRINRLMDEMGKFGPHDVVPLSTIILLQDLASQLSQIATMTEGCMFDAVLLASIVGLLNHESGTRSSGNSEVHGQGCTAVVYAGDLHIQRYVEVLQRAGAERVFESSIKRSRCTQLDIEHIFPDHLTRDEHV